MTFETRWLNGSAADVLEGIFAPDHLVMLSGSTAGIPVVSNFREISPRFEQFQNICVNPVVSPRFRVPTKRQSIVISLPGNTLVAQFAKALYLRQIIPLELAVFVPAKMTTEFWFQSGTAAKNKKFATTAFKLGYSAGNPFDPGFMASMPSASGLFPPPAASAQLLKSVGIELRDDRKNLVLYKREKKSRPKIRPNESQLKL